MAWDAFIGGGTSKAQRIIQHKARADKSEKRRETATRGVSHGGLAEKRARD
jgi:hypothetical protein